MCGICGVASADPRSIPIDAEALHAMTVAMTHRGPDESGHLLEPGVALGMRRLSIIDLASSHQPLANEDGTVTTVFNGEIFNFPELRNAMVRNGHRLATSGDTETIVHLYEDHGNGFVERLRGMFAIAIWDARRRKLVLARDRLGVKPLYYMLGPSGLAFASEVKCLIAAGLLQPRLDPLAASLFLALGYVPGPRTLFEGVLKLPPATLIEWHDGQLTGPAAYWSPTDAPPVPPGSWQEDEEHLLELLRDSVRARMISDVPLGVMLSGGLDSSLIAALMAEASSRPIETFSVGFAEDAGANELTWARRTATRLGANHHELETSAAEHEALLDDALWHLEEPIADLSFLGFLLLSRLAREHVTVALCGQAADELLGGYQKHLAARLCDLAAGVPSAGRRLLASTAELGGRQGGLQRLTRAIAADRDLERLWAMSAVITPALQRELEGPRLRGEDAFSLLAQSHAGGLPLPPDRSRLTRTLLLDLQLALPDLMFVYFDKMSMATSLEVRVPFADHDLVTFCMSLADNRRIRRLRSKEILRRISTDLVDEAIINRPKRGFFRAASSSWLERNMATVREMLLDARCRDRGLLDPGVLRGWLDGALGDGRAGDPLLIAFMLEQWHRLFVDEDGLAQQRAREARAAALAATA
jgi:asparagine synthase (glutamine-hydrolysing)